MTLKSIFTAGLITLLLAACDRPPKERDTMEPDAITELPSQNLTDSMSYILGVRLGMEIKYHNYGELNYPRMKQGIDDALSAVGFPDLDDPAFTEQFDIDPKLNLEIEDRYISKRNRAIGLDNEIKGRRFLDEQFAAGDVDTTDSGLRYKMLLEGEGPRIALKDTVKVTMTVKTHEGTVIEKTMSEPAEMVISPSRFNCPGLLEGLQLLRGGDECTLTLPPSLIGHYADYPLVGPNKVIIIDLSVDEVTKYVEPKPSKK